MSTISREIDWNDPAQRESAMAAKWAEAEEIISRERAARAQAERERDEARDVLASHDRKRHRAYAERDSLIEAAGVNSSDHDDPTPVAVEAIRAAEARAVAAEAALSLVGQWAREYGAALKPRGVDSYGEGMRDAKEQVGRILASPAVEAEKERKQ